MKEASYHLTLLAQNRTGFENLLQAGRRPRSWKASTSSPRIDKELLAAHSEGIICLSGCVSERVEPRACSAGGEAGPRRRPCEVAAWFRELFGDRYFIEIQNNGLEIQRLAMEGCRRGRHAGMGIPLVATSDAHYVHREDAEAQDVLLCINTGKFRTDTNRMRMEGDEFYLRSPEEMYAAFPGHARRRRPQSQEIADSRRHRPGAGQAALPRLHAAGRRRPRRTTSASCACAGLQGALRRRAASAATDGELSRRGHGPARPRAGRDQQARLPQLLPDRLGLRPLRRERRASRPRPAARASARWSAYALYLSHVCPLEYDLLFERFLDENRREAPDIDIDFCQERRGEVIQYVKEKYGEANVAQIGTFGTLAARAAIRDVGRALGMPIPRVDADRGHGARRTAASRSSKALEKSDDLKKAYDTDPEVRELLDLAMQIEGLARNVGTHAAAVVIADRPLTEYVPLAARAGQGGRHHAMGDGRRRERPAC